MSGPAWGSEHAPTATELPPTARAAWGQVLELLDGQCDPILSPAALAHLAIAQLLDRGAMDKRTAQVLIDHVAARVRAGHAL